MINCYIITIHPNFIKTYSEFGVFKSAIQKQIVNIEVINLRDFAIDKHGTIDDKPYGGGEGMVLRPEPLANAIKSIKTNPYVILTSPHGELWTNYKAQEFSKFIQNNNLDKAFVWICGRFSGIDQRFIDLYVHKQISIGEYIISGGELAALVIIDSILRFIPGVLGKKESAQKDSFCKEFKGGLEYPLYTRPQIFEGHQVPQVLLSGNHNKIKKWKTTNLIFKKTNKKL